MEYKIFIEYYRGQDWTRVSTSVNTGGSNRNRPHSNRNRKHTPIKIFWSEQSACALQQERSVHYFWDYFSFFSGSHTTRVDLSMLESKFC